MRKEYISYEKNLPIRFKLLDIRNYPLHWHDSIEIIFVLKGSLKIEIGVELYEIGEGQLEIINHNEIHSISSSEENIALVLNIDPNFFEKYYDGGREIFYYADSSDENIQKSKKYKLLRKHIIELFYEYVKKYEDRDYIIEKKLLKLMYHLLNNFHYLFYEEESLREDEFELERYHRIVNYIKKNYSKKISLKEIADKEYLSSQYLSYKIKKTFGYSFIDFLNLIRVEQSIKLLLSTDKALSEISDEVGFSHIRYYNKHFKKHLGILPKDYREKYRIGQKELEKEKDLKELDLKLALNHFQSYLAFYPRFEYNDRIEKYEIDFKKDSIGKLERINTISISLDKDLFYLNKKDLLEKVSTDLDIKYVLLEDVDKLVYASQYSYNWYFLEELLGFLITLGLRPIIFRDIYDLDFKSFKEHLYKRSSNLDLSKLTYIEKKNYLGKKNFILESNKAYNDNLFIVNYLIDKYLYGGKIPIVKLIDSLENSKRSNSIFLGDSGILSLNNIKKPSYFILKFFNLLGEDILYLEKDHIVTKSKDGYEILCFHPGVDFKKGYVDKKKRFSFNILGIDQDYTMVKYNLNKDHGSFYDKWKYLNKPEILKEDYVDLFQKSVHPDVKFSYVGKSNVFNLTPKVKDKGAVLYKFTKIR